MTFAQIIIDITTEKLDRSFTYRVPESLEGEIGVGMVVLVPFGSGNRVRKGYVIALSDESPYETDKIKDIRGLSTDASTTESRLIALAAWIRENYGGTMLQALRTVLPIQSRVRQREEKLLVLTEDREAALAEYNALVGTRFKARTRLLGAILERPDGRLPASAARELGTTSQVLAYFEKKGIIRTESEERLRLPFEADSIPVQEAPALTKDQEAAVLAVQKAWEQGDDRPVLIHGVTGSGKTEVYMRLIEEVLQEGRQAIVLIPEISLTYQTVQRFCGRFGDQVSVLHSRLSQGERYDQFLRAKRGDISIMVGPRSALFTPFSNLGLIIMDEEHETAYKSESTPRYHTRETACARAELEHAHVVFGSATPSLEAFHRTVTGEYILQTLLGRFEERPLPEVEIVDMRRELKEGRRSILSRSLAEGIRERLTRKEQVMLFLNRRGYAGFVSCRSCGEVIKCPHCDVSLSLHTGGRLLCHYCGFETQKPELCPSCGSPYIGGFKAGTQQVEEVLGREFPAARVLRMDFDTTRTKGSYEQILASFAAHEADILIGTQMIVKGHDFPEVTLVGVLAADLSLNAADFRCAERTFQLLTQAVGRSGRGRRPGNALIQTYHPDHYSIRAAVSQDYNAFFEEEFSFRLMMNYPPAGSMLAVLGAGENEAHLAAAMGHIAGFVGKVQKHPELSMIGPAQAAISKLKDMHRMVLYLKHPSRQVLVRYKNLIEKYVEINSGFRNLYIQIDMTV